MGRSRVADEQLRAAAGQAQNLRQLLRAVGLAGRGGNYALYRQRLLRLGITDARFHGTRRPADPSLEELCAAAAGARSVAGVCRALGLPDQGRTHRRIGDLLRAHEVPTGHFVGQAWRKGSVLPTRPGRPLQDLLREGSRIGSAALKARLLREGVLPAVCAHCTRTEWLGGPIPLELDHVDGNGTDNRLENLRLLCPNCHALTDTYRGRNIGRAGS